MTKRIVAGVVLALVLLTAAVYMARGPVRAPDRRLVTSTGRARDSVALLRDSVPDSVRARARAREERDTLCFASRIGLPCNPF